MGLAFKWIYRRRDSENRNETKLLMHTLDKVLNGWSRGHTRTKEKFFARFAVNAKDTLLLSLFLSYIFMIPVGMGKEE